MDGWKDTFLQCSSLMGSFQDIYWQTSNGIYNGSLEIGIDMNQWDMAFFINGWRCLGVQIGKVGPDVLIVYQMMNWEIL